MISDLKNFKWRNKSSWRLFFKSFTGKERAILSLLIVMIVAAGGFWLVMFIRDNTEIVPKQGGKYSEGLIGEPLYVNPLLSIANGVDSDIEFLIFSRLFTYDTEGKLQPDLVDHYEISEDYKTYTLYLKENLLWEDGNNITASDVEFTFNLIRNQEYKSPLLLNFGGVTIEKVSDHQINFITKNVYSPFLNNLTFGILPQHIWRDVTPTNFQLVEYNLKPVGSGPFKFSKLKKDRSGHISSYELERNENYYAKKPYLEKVIFKFYPDENSSIEAFNKKEIMGIQSVSPTNRSKIQQVNIHTIRLPRYYAVFLNQTKNKALADIAIRKALLIATDKKKIVEEVFNNEADIVNGPILDGMPGYNPNTKTYEFSIDEARKLLEEKGWTDVDGDNVREKDSVRAEFTIVTSNLPEFVKTAEILENSWKEIGVKANMKFLEVGELQQDYIKPREYEAILFGEVLGLNPDPYSFWHSSEKKDPGLNLAMYDNRDVDKALETARQTKNEEERIAGYQLFQNIIAEEVPAIFLYSPNYLNPRVEVIKNSGVKVIASPAYRFSDIADWYTLTKRVWKTDLE